MIARWVGKVMALLCLLGDTGVGAGWALGSPNRTRAGRSYDVARELMSIRSWGIVLLALAVVACVEVLLGHARTVRPAWALLAGYWTFWMVMFVGAALGHNGSLTAPWFILLVIAAHSVPLLAPLLRREREEREELADLDKVLGV